MYSKPTTKIKLHVDKLTAFPLKSETRQGCPLSPYLFNAVIYILAKELRQLKESRGYKLEKKRSAYNYAQKI